jgi:predicted DNA-binding protein (MmcQ/YjbR family)
MEWVRQHCLSLPKVTEQIQWENHLLFKIGGKMFAMTTLIPSPVQLSLKVTQEQFPELTDRPGIIPAPYLARAHWVAFESLSALPRGEIKELLSGSYQLVLEKLPKKTQAELGKPVKKKK